MTRRRRTTHLLVALALSLTAACSESGDEGSEPGPTTTTAAGPVTTGTAVTAPSSTVVEVTTTTTEGPTTTTTGPEDPLADIVDGQYRNLETWGPVTMALPDAFDLYDQGERACVSYLDPAEVGDFCDGMAFARGQAVAQATQGGPYDGDAGELAWYSGTDVPQCHPGIDPELLVMESELVVDETRTVAGQQAEFRTWTITCSNGGALAVDQWYLPDADLLLTNRGGPASIPLADHIALTG